MSEQKQRVRLGLFVLICMMLLAGMVILFGGAPVWFSKRVSYVVLFSDAPGLEAGTPIRRSGVKVGEVRSLSLNEVDGKVRVAIRIDPDKYIPRTGDEPVISRGLIVGDTSIDFVPKNALKPERGIAYDSGAEIEGISPLNARAIVSQATDIIPEAERSLNQIRLSMQRFAELTPQFKQTMEEIGLLAKATREFIPNLTRATDDLKDIVASAKEFGPEIRKTNEEVRLFIKTATQTTEDAGIAIKTLEPKLSKSLDTVTKTGDSLGKLLQDDNQRMINEMLKNLSAASAKVETLLQEGTKTLEQFRTDTKVLTQRLDRTLTKGEEVMQDISKATKPLAERGPKVMQNLENGTDQLNRLFMDGRDMLKTIARAEGSFAKFLGDPALYNNLNDTAFAITRILPRIDRALKDFEVFADKLARHPEVLGLGGAVRPSTGLKETSPSTPPITSPSFRPRN